jgi:hypothetical protein
MLFSFESLLLDRIILNIRNQKLYLVRKIKKPEGLVRISGNSRRGRGNPENGDFGSLRLAIPGEGLFRALQVQYFETL